MGKSRNTTIAIDTPSVELIASLKEEVKALTKEVKKLSSAATPSVIKGFQGLADFLGISKSVAQKMKNEGIIPYYQYDRVVLFKPDEVLEALKKVTPQSHWTIKAALNI